jgi:hypothetical protein
MWIPHRIRLKKIIKKLCVLCDFFVRFVVILLYNPLWNVGIHNENFRKKKYPRQLRRPQ